MSSTTDVDVSGSDLIWPGGWVLQYDRVVNQREVRPPSKSGVDCEPVLRTRMEPRGRVTRHGSGIGTAGPSCRA